MTVGSRVLKQVTFASSSTDETQVVPVPDSSGAGLIAVYVRKTGGAGTATLAVNGSFVSDPAADDLFEIQAATSVGAGVVTNILGTSEDHRFPYLVLVLDRTGVIAVDVYVSAF